MSWSGETNISRLALADAAGQVCIYDWSDEELRERQIVQVGEPSRLALSLDWDNKRTNGTGAVVASVSDGSISILRGQNQLDVTESWHAHEYEPWIAAWDYWDTQSVWTGGDDCKLKLWDLRQGTSMPVSVKKDFSAGVTSIQSHPLAENIFAVGSYDAILRLFDKRVPHTPLVEHDVSGGIWRVRWHPTDPSKLLVACMHDGFKVVSIDSGYSSCETSMRFDEHGKDALAYGVDWCSMEGEQNGQTALAASCSFYDHRLRSWQAT